MTTLIEQVQATIAPIVSGGAWYGVNTTEPPVYPYAVFLRIVSPTNVTLQGPSDVQNTIFQIDIFSRTVAEGQALEAALEAAMNTAPFSSVQIDQRDGYEPEVKAFRFTGDYSVWSSN